MLEKETCTTRILSPALEVVVFRIMHAVMMRLECWRKKPAPQGFFLQRVHARCLARSSCDISCIFLGLLSSKCGEYQGASSGNPASARWRASCSLRFCCSRWIQRCLDQLCVTIARSVCTCYQLCVFRLTCRPDSSCMHAVSRFLQLSSMACPCKLSSSYVYTSGGPGCMGSRRRR